MEENRHLKCNLEKVISSVPEIREEKQKLAKERDKLEQELEKQKYLARELQDQVETFYQSICPPSIVLLWDHSKMTSFKSGFFLTPLPPLSRSYVPSHLPYVLVSKKAFPSLLLSLYLRCTSFGSFRSIF